MTRKPQNRQQTSPKSTGPDETRPAPDSPTSHRADPTSLDGRKQIVARFLRQCNAYADGKLAEYAARQATERAAGDPAALAATETKIAQWQSYVAFNEHALSELATDRLDDWFDERFET